uniref:Diacylglycerol kinase n=1 Tax=Parastrongyloides trichosuri TaxID=131310 RepID=A0A0N4Z1N0_PARTI
MQRSTETSNILEGKSFSKHDSSTSTQSDTGIFSFSGLLSLPNNSYSKSHILDGEYENIIPTMIGKKGGKGSSSKDKKKTKNIRREGDDSKEMSNNHIDKDGKESSTLMTSNNDSLKTPSRVPSTKQIFKMINSMLTIENNIDNSVSSDKSPKYVKYINDDDGSSLDTDNNIMLMRKKIKDHLKSCNIPRDYVYPILTNVDLISKLSYQKKLHFILSYFDTNNDGIINKVDINLFLNQLIAYLEGENKSNDSIQNILTTLGDEMMYDGDCNITISDSINIIKNNHVIEALIGQNNETTGNKEHHWAFKNSPTPLYCAICCNKSSILKKRQGLVCKLCSFFCHESCSKNAPNNCITDYVISIGEETEDVSMHHWLEISEKKKCSSCFLKIKPFQGKRCRWCHLIYHQRCLKNAKNCTYGCFNNFILPRDWCEKNIDTGKVNISCKDISRKPVLVLINPKSGGNIGNEIFEQFLQLLHPRQVYSLNEFTPDEIINKFKNIENYRIIVGGGDGTITWVQEAFDRCGYNGDNRPPMMILPIGTGNDLSRSLKWGGGVIKIKPLELLKKMEKSKIVFLDRWKIDIDKKDDEIKLPATIFNNYFSIGIDAQICHKFHKKRETNPELFSNRTRNKLHYVEIGAIELFTRSWREFCDDINIICDGEPLIIEGLDLEGICLLNTPFIHGGTNMSHDKKKSVCIVAGKYIKRCIRGKKNEKILAPKCIGDGLIEIIGFKNMIHIISLRSGFKEPLSLAQVKDIQISTRKQFPMQIDGEPWLQNPCDIHISHYNKVPMFKKK